MSQLLVNKFKQDFIYQTTPRRKQALIRLYILEHLKHENNPKYLKSIYRYYLKDKFPTSNYVEAKLKQESLKNDESLIQVYSDMYI